MVGNCCRPLRTITVSSQGFISLLLNVYLFVYCRLLGAYRRHFISSVEISTPSVATPYPGILTFSSIATMGHDFMLLVKSNFFTREAFDN